MASTVTPGSTGTPAAAISSLAATLDPIASIAAGDGPTKISPAAPHWRAKPAFSERNPYPGWIACAPVTRAASMIRSPRR
jgi:hypothetical protein